MAKVMIIGDVGGCADRSGHRWCSTTPPYLPDRSRPSVVRFTVGSMWSVHRPAVGRSAALITRHPNISLRTLCWCVVSGFTKTATPICAARHAVAISRALPGLSSVRRENGRLIFAAPACETPRRWTCRLTTRPPYACTDVASRSSFAPTPVSFAENRPTSTTSAPASTEAGGLGDLAARGHGARWRSACAAPPCDPVSQADSRKPTGCGGPGRSRPGATVADSRRVTIPLMRCGRTGSQPLVPVPECCGADSGRACASPVSSPPRSAFTAPTVRYVASTYLMSGSPVASLWLSATVSLPQQWSGAAKSTT